MVVLNFQYLQHSCASERGFVEYDVQLRIVPSHRAGNGTTAELSRSETFVAPSLLSAVAVGHSIPDVRHWVIPAKLEVIRR